MAIGTDAAIEFFGTQDEVTTTSAAVTNALFSIASDTSEWTNDDDAPGASVTLNSAFGAALAGGTYVDLYCQPLNVEATSDNPIPIAGYKGIYLGSFLMDDIATEHHVTIDIALPNYKTSSVYTFYVHNQSGQQMSAGWELRVTPKAIGPHP